MKKKLLSLLVVICMIIGMLPMIAMAAEQGNAVMDYATGVGTKENSVLIPGEAAYFKVTDPDADGNTYLTKGDYASDYDVAYIYEDVPTLYLNGANIQNDLPFVLYAWEAGTTEKVRTDLKVVIQATSTIHSTSALGAGDTLTGLGAAIAMFPEGGEATITSIGDAKLTVSAIAPDSYSPLVGTGSQRGSVILTGAGDLTLKDANIDVDFSKVPNSKSTCPSGISADGGTLTIDGGNVRVGLGLREDAYEMNSPLQLVERDSGGNLVIQNGANVLILQDNDARPIRYDGTLTISDSNVEVASVNPNPEKTRVAFGGAAPTFNYTKEYTAVGTAEKPEVENDAATLENPAAEIADLSADTNIGTYYYFKVTVKEAAPKLPSFAGTYMTLDVVNDVNFLIAKSALEGLDIDDLTAHFVMERHEGKTDRVATVELEQDPYYEAYYRAKFHDVAAAELCDEITVVLKNSEGNVVTEEFTITMGRAIQKLYEASTSEQDAKWRPLCVALLNYGAAAQIAFNYNVTDLATKYLPDC